MMLWICLWSGGTGSVLTSTAEELMRAVGPGSLPAHLLQGFGILREMTSDLHVEEVSPLCPVKPRCQGQGHLDGSVG